MLMQYTYALPWPIHTFALTLSLFFVDVSRDKKPYMNTGDDKYREQVMGMEPLDSDYLTSNRKIQGRKWGNITTLHRDYLRFN